jgi:hypothetical protein
MVSGCKIYKPKAAFSKTTFCASRLGLSFERKLMKCYIWNASFYGVEIWTLGKIYQKYLKRFDVSCGRRSVGLIV